MTHIVVYTLPSANPKQRLRFHRELYGFDDYSNRGKYRYYRKGLLGKEDYEKLIRGALLIRSKLHPVLAYLRRFKAEYKVFKIA